MALFDRGRVRACRCLLASSLLFSCATPGPPEPAAPVVVRDEPYLLDPTASYPLTGAPDLTRTVGDAFDDLRFGGDLAAIEAAGREVLATDPGFHPAAVLLAQVEVLEHRDAAAAERLRAVVDELPGYRAARLLLGHAAERSGDLPAAFEAFAGFAEVSRFAAQRLDELRPRALEIVANRLRDDLARGRLEDAETELAWLAEWAPESREALEGGRLVALERGDPEAELAAVKQLAELTGERDYRLREAELEVEIGDVGSGLEKLEALVAELPDDPQLAEALAHAEFIWRLQLLPTEVQDIGRQAELSRADAATLLYWLVPRVRSSPITNPPIAADILDHPRREVILRVLNLGLMDIDETLHRFEPSAPASRIAVLKAQLTLLASSPRGLSCLDGSGTLDLDPSWSSLCRHAARCRLIPEAADCRPAAAISGAEAVELFRRTLNLLGSGR